MTKKHDKHDEDEFEPPEVNGSGDNNNNNSIIWVNEFTEKSARSFALQLQQQSSQDNTAPIIIYIDSYGGEVYALLTMISAMESVPNQLITVALGKAMSAGSTLLAHGDIRYASPYCSLMIHEMSAGTGGHINDLNTHHTHLAKLNEKMMEMLASKLKIKGGLEELRKKLSNTRDLYLTAEEAKNIGLIDHVGTPILVKNTKVEYMLADSKPNKKVSSKKGKK